MNYSTEKKENYIILTIKEEKLDSTKAPGLKSELVKFNANGEKYIILDMSEVKYVDSSGLSSILVGNRLCNGAEGKLVLSQVNSHVDKLLEISQLKGVLEVVPNLDEAAQFVRLTELENDLKAGE